MKYITNGKGRTRMIDIKPPDEPFEGIEEEESVMAKVLGERG